MKSYTKIYLDYMLKNFNLEPHELLCEIPGCGKPIADIHHILGKGKYPELKNEISNLIGLSRDCHSQYGQKKQYLKFLNDIVNERTKNRG